MSDRTAIAFAAFLLAAAVASPQSLTGTLSGAVRDELGAAVAGASVVVTGTTGSSTTLTDAGGGFRFAALAPGRYELSVRSSGFTPRSFEQLSLRVGAQLALDVVLKLAAREERVEVQEGAPVVDVASASTSNVLSSDLLFNLPIDRGDSLFNYAPGVTFYSAFGGGQGTTNAVLLDGVDTREPIDGRDYILMSHNVVQEVEVQGIGAPAEYGGFTGGVVNTLTRSGGNRTGGLFEARWSGEALGADNVSAEVAAQNPALADPVVTKKLVDLTAQVSGPLVKDRLFYFADVQRYERVDDPAGQITRMRESDWRFNTKLTLQGGRSDHLSLMLQYDRYYVEGLNAYAPFQSTDELANAESGPELVWNLQWRHSFGPKTLLEARYVGWTSRDDVVPAVAEPGHLDTATDEPSVSAGEIYHSDIDRSQLALTLSRHVDDFVGAHDLKLGFESGRGSERDRFHYVDDVFFYDYEGAPDQAVTWSYDVRTRNKRNSLFVQDAWRVKPRLTLNLGLRFDWIRGGNDEIGDPYETTSLAPRLGAAFDLTGNKTTVLKASWSRYVEAAIGAFYSRALPGYGDYVVFDNTGPELEEIDREPAVLYPVDGRIRHPRTDEFSIGFERAFGPDLRLGLTLLGRRGADFVNSVFPDARFLPVDVTNLLTGGPLTLYRWENRAASEGSPLITNPDGFAYRDPGGAVLGAAEAYRRYGAAMLVLSRRLRGRWQAQASYVLSRAEGTVDNFNIDAGNLGVGDPFEQPSRALVNSDGLLRLDYRHAAKVLGTYKVPRLELALSGVFRFASGLTYTPFQTVPARTLGLAGGGLNVFLEPRGSRRVPASTVLDLRAEKIFTLGGKHRLGVYADALNVFNAGSILFAQSRVPSAQIPGIEQPVAFGAPTRLVPARQVVLGARFWF